MQWQCEEKVASECQKKEKIIKEGQISYFIMETLVSQIKSFWKTVYIIML